jgi:hypothetical protein
MPGHDRDRDRDKSPAFLPRLATSGPGPFLAGSGRQHQDGDVLVLLDQLEDFLGGIALADHPLRRDAGDAIGARRERVELPDPPPRALPPS